MDILVYGAGVIGCELAHMLCRGGGRVTLLARGSWRDTISRDGLVIRHYAQLRTTVDRPALVDRLEAEQVYDLVFVVMQAGQLPAVLPEVAVNRSRFVVLVGNNPAVEQSLRLASEGSPVEKEIAFGFQATGGRREDGRVVSIHAGVGMTVGGPDGPLSEEFRRRLLQAFSGTGCRLAWEDRMDAWLKCHLALILPVCYVCYAVGGRLPEAFPAQRRAILDAALEGCVMLRSLGVPIRTQDSEDYYRPGPKRRCMAAMLYLMAKTPLGRLAASDHAMRAVEELRALDAAFEDLRRRAGTPMPVWDALRAGMPDWDTLSRAAAP
ncbi:2-dehydropantoate 2-reductase [Oscillospiraceae bacterium]|nr:2-dehydropantoate 2-reductase [Oscillospiraceae bacterium]BDF75837.1 2-dehydropantoate 2-reductase [Oscillospiraceae bacterium]